ncbi:hypothetical protein RF11_01227 [Thelohanellus kitauei]|uniref:Uncharacterized protein n=1 Tax=Thelohanellus kitauei TaxID=669202 RepID=A0A0C2NLS1_THEKT|nr:hypothetical protein RF11_01227 [Thelohanellus kitauei]
MSGESTAQTPLKLSPIPIKTESSILENVMNSPDSTNFSNRELFKNLNKNTFDVSGIFIEEETSPTKNKDDVADTGYSGVKTRSKRKDGVRITLITSSKRKSSLK